MRVTNSCVRLSTKPFKVNCCVRLTILAQAGTPSTPLRFFAHAMTSQRESLVRIVGQAELLELIEAYVGPRTPFFGYGPRPAWDTSARSALGLERLNWQLACAVLASLKARDGPNSRASILEQACCLSLFLRSSRDSRLHQG